MDPASHDLAPIPEEEVDLQALQRAVANPDLARPDDILNLQQNYGNRAISQMLHRHGIQAQLTVGPVGDKYEEEADKIAQEVSRKPAPDVQRYEEEEEELDMKPLAAAITPLVQRSEEEEELQMKPLLQRSEEEEELQMKPLLQRFEEEEELQMKAVDSDGSFEADDDIQRRLKAQEGSGSPLPEKVQADMEGRFGTDFDDVQVHTDSESAQLSRDLKAQAFTHGRDIYFGAGKYNPDSGQGQELLAHELTHVVQQTGGQTRQPEAEESKELNRKPDPALIQRDDDDDDWDTDSDEEEEDWTGPTPEQMAQIQKVLGDWVSGQHEPTRSTPRETSPKIREIVESVGAKKEGGPRSLSEELQQVVGGWRGELERRSTPTPGTQSEEEIARIQEQHKLSEEEMNELHMQMSGGVPIPPKGGPPEIKAGPTAKSSGKSLEQQLQEARKKKGMTATSDAGLMERFRASAQRGLTSAGQGIKSGLSSAWGRVTGDVKAVGAGIKEGATHPKAAGKFLAGGVYRGSTWRGLKGGLPEGQQVVPATAAQKSMHAAELRAGTAMPGRPGGMKSRRKDLRSLVTQEQEAEAKKSEQEELPTERKSLANIATSLGGDRGRGGGEEVLTEVKELKDQVQGLEERVSSLESD